MAAVRIDRTQALREAYGAEGPIAIQPDPQGPGNDTVVVTATTTGYGTLDGGGGTDTLQINPANPATIANSSFGPYSLSVAVFNNATTLISFERLVFNTTVGSVMSAQFAYGGNNGALNQIGSGLAANSEIVGGAGLDIVTLLYNSANLPGTVTAPSFTYTNWTTSTRAYLGGDRVSLVVTGNGATTINGVAHTGVLSLTGGGGSDIINGSDDMDALSGGAGGADILHGNGGNDTLGLVNSYFVSNGNVGAETTRTGVGSLFDGGSGTDFLVLGGNVNFQGVLQSIEGIFLQASFTNLNNTGQPLNTGSQYSTRALFSSATFGVLPANLELDGAGTIVVTMGNGGETFIGAGFTFDPGSNVLFELIGGDGTDTITGTSNGDYIEANLGNDTMFGGGGDDIIQFGVGTQQATGGSGADRFRPGAVLGTVTDFTVGVDKIDMSDTGVSSMSRFADLSFVDNAGSATLSADNEGVHYEMRLQGVSVAGITANDILLGTGGTVEINFGTTFNDLLFGFELNDELHGGDGNDRIYGGGGVDKLYGDAGTDTIILDGAITSGGIYDGGAGTDTLLLRAHATTTSTPYGPQSAYGLLATAPGTGLISVERLQFDSLVGTAMLAVINVGAGVTEYIGGAGHDTVVVYAGTAGTYSLSGVTLTSWNTAVGGDSLVLYVNPGNTAAVTFNARSDVGNQALISADGADTLNGSTFADLLQAGGGADILNGNGGADTLLGEAGNDRLVVGASSAGTAVNGGADTDTLAVTGSTSLATLVGIEAVELSGGANLTLTSTQFTSGLAFNSAITGTGSITINIDAPFQALFASSMSVASTASFTINGSSGTDFIKGAHAANTINGGAGSDFIRGGNLVDTIDGGADGDKIIGFGGADFLTGGGGNDQFRYLFASDSGTGAAADRITDFVSGTDKFDFRQLDSDPGTAGVQLYGLSYIDSQAFHATGGAEIRYATAGTDLRVELDLNGDGLADMHILLSGLGGQTLASGDFLI